MDDEVKGVRILRGRPIKPGKRGYQLSKAEKEAAVAIYNSQEDSAIVNMVTEKVANRLKEIPPEFLTWSEKALRRTLERKDELDERDYRLRIAIWDEYNSALGDNLKTMSLNRAMKGVCTNRYFETYVLTNPKKLAWIFFPPADYTKALNEILHLGLREIREIMSMPLTKEDGKLDYSLMEKKIKIWEKTEARVRGAIPQALNIQQKSVNLNLNKDAPRNITNDMSMEELDAQIRELEGKEPEALEEPKTIEVIADKESQD